MDKSIYTQEYAIVTKLLQAARKRAGLTQIELAERIDQTQSFVSKIECGDRRLDIIQLRTILKAVDMDLVTFVDQLEQRIPRRKKK